MRSKIKQDLLVGLMIYALLLAFAVQSNSLPRESAFYPRMVLGVFGFLNTIMIIQAFGRKESTDSEVISIRSFVTPLLFFLGVVLYVGLFRYVGYFPATFVLLPACMLILKVRPLWKIFSITGGYLVFIYVLFVIWLKVPML